MRKTTITITARLPVANYERLRVLTKTLKRSQSEVINGLIHDALRPAEASIVVKPKKIDKTCSCSRHHAVIPDAAIYFNPKEPDFAGWYWNCLCKSTLFYSAWGQKESK